MDNRVTLGFVPTGVTAWGANLWTVVAEVDDPLECNDGWMVCHGDIVYLDLRGSASAPGTVGRYEITTVHAASSRRVTVGLEWAGAAAPVSPMECLGIRGYLCQPIDVVGTVKHPVQQTILIEQAVMDLAKQAELFAIGNNGGEGGGTDTEQAFFTDAVLSPGELVHVLPNGKAVLACPQDPARMPAIGIVVGYSNGTVRVRTGGIVGGGDGLLPGAPVFVGNAGLPVTDPAGITLPAALQLLGVALNSTIMSLTITGQMVKRA